MTYNPFAVLGLPARPDLTDEQVHAAWYAVATATHPDRFDGGDRERYAAASAAFAALRSPWARSEAYADLVAAAPPATAPAARAVSPPRVAGVLASARLLPARVRHGRPLRLAARVLAAAVAAAVTARAGVGGPVTAAVVTGLAVWLASTVRADLAPPPGR
ncbi:MAG TPA: hypothetical protein VGS19_06730 [Streptosporangiaceae bacterium]|nr:hypothetical protein [Streptosporangiaceae bacterium]